MADALPVAAPTIRYPSVLPGLRRLRWGLGVLQKIVPALAFRLAWRLFTTPRRLPTKDWEAPALAEARRRTSATGSGPVAVYEWGPPAAPAVLLVHGWEHRASFWRVWVKPLQAAGYRVVALDAPAHGASPGRQTTLVQYAAAVQHVLNETAAAGPVRGIVAHSFGADAVAGLPVQLPAGAALSRLVLMSVPVGVGEVIHRFADFLGLNAGVVARFEAHIAHRAGRSVASFATATTGPGTRAEQVLIIHDEGDEIVPFAEGQAVAAAWPEATLLATQGLGHNRILRDAAVVRATLGFLQ